MMINSYTNLLWNLTFTNAKINKMIVDSIGFFRIQKMESTLNTHLLRVSGVMRTEAVSGKSSVRQSRAVGSEETI